MINTKYDNWQLHNLTNMQATQASKSANKLSSSSQIANNPTNTDALTLSKQAENSLTNSTALTENAAAQVQNESRQGGLQSQTAKVEPKPDYRAVSLIKNSQIELPEATAQDAATERIQEMVESRKQRDIESALSTQKTDISNVKESSASADTVESEDAVPKVKTEPAKAFEGLRIAEATNVSDKANKVDDIKNDVSESSSNTVNTSSELAEKQMSSKVTPYQEKSIQAYQRQQGYQNSVTMSVMSRAV